MALTIKSWNVRHVGASGHGCVMNFDERYDGDNWNNRVSMEKIQNNPSWEVFVNFGRDMDWQTDSDYPYSAQIEDNDNLFRLEFEAKFSMRAGLQYGSAAARGPVPSGYGRHKVTITLLDRNGNPLYRQAGEYWIDA